MHLRGAKFVERGSLLFSEQGYFGNIYTQKRGQKAVTEGVEGGAGPSYIVKKGPAIIT